MTINTLDEQSLGVYLEDNVTGFRGLKSAEKFAGGQSNPTFLLTAETGQYVLRRQPSGDLLKSAHAVDREYRVTRALADTPVPVTKVFHLCEDRDVLGSMFYVMSYEQGRIFWDPALPELEKEQRAGIYDEMNRILAALHDVNIESVGLGDYGRPGDYFGRQIKRWSDQYRASETEKIEAMDMLMACCLQTCQRTTAKLV